MRNKRRVMICGALPPPYMGPATTFNILMESEFVRAYDVIFFEMKFFSYKQMSKGSITKFIKLIKYFFTFIYNVIKKRPYYILYPISFDKSPFLKDLLFVYLSRVLGCRIIQFDLGYYLVDLYNASNRVYRKLLTLMLKKIDAFIVMGGNTKELYSGWFPAEKIYIVPGSVNDTSGIYENINIDKHQTVNVLYFSLLSASKGLWTALNSIPGIIKKNSGIRFAFAGPVNSPDTIDKFQEYINEHKLENYVTYEGYIEDENKKIEYFRNSDIFIFPTHRDVFGLVLLHAMAESLPLIASIEGNIPEIVENGINGYLIPKGDSEQLTQKILELACNSGLREKMGKINKAKYLANYTPANYGQNMIKAFESIINSETVL